MLKNPHSPFRICGYARTAGDDQTGTALDTQRAAVARWCDERQAELVETIAEVASGAVSVGTALQAMLRHATGPTRPYDAVVVVSLCRLSRDPAELASVIAQLERAGIELITVQEDSDPLVVAISRQRLLRIRAQLDFQTK